MSTYSASGNPILVAFSGLLTKIQRARPVVPTGVAAADGVRKW